MEKYRSKRQLIYPFFTSFSNGACNFNVFNPCKRYTSVIARSGSSLQNAITRVQKHKFFLNGLVSLSALQNGGMCAPNTNLFTANAFSALDLGHITLSQLATLNLFPVPSVDTDTLLNAGYITTFGQTNLLTALGAQASIFGHIVPSQLQSLSLYPLQEGLITSDILIQAGYLTKDCIPTALGLAALHIHYLPSNNFVSFGCLNKDYSQTTLLQLANARYIYGESNIITPVGLASILTGFFSKHFYQRLGIFPLSVDAQTQSVDDIYQEQTTQQALTILNDLVYTGYLQSNTYLLTGAGYYAITLKYFTIENLRNLNVWPCPSRPSINAFVSAGYATYSGHLTTLGYSLLHAQYYPYDWLPALGIHLHDEFHILYHALRHGGFWRSHYQAAHNTINNDADVESGQVKKKILNKHLKII
jgi:hypothetical protein